MASGSLHQLARIAESTYGTTPSTPTFVICRHTQQSGGITKGNFRSQELRGDRGVHDVRHGARNVDFEFPFELSYGSYDTELEALMGGTWTANVLKMGTTRRHLTYEGKYGDLEAGAKLYERFKGSQLNTMSLQVNRDAMVTGTFGLVAQDIALDTAIITGATYTAASTTSPFDSFTGSISEGGSTIAIATEIQLNVNNGLEKQFVLFSNVTQQPDIGYSLITGQLGLRFVNTTMFEKFVNETVSSLSFTLTDAAGNDLTFLLPRIKYTGGTKDVGGPGSIPLVMPFEALYDSTTNNSNLVITRAPA